MTNKLMVRSPKVCGGINQHGGIFQELQFFKAPYIKIVNRVAVEKTSGTNF